MTDDTIFAPATPLGGALAVIRISGSESHSIIGRIFTGRVRPQAIVHGRIMRGDFLIDDAMCAIFRAPKSYTGEDMAELYVHGSSAVVDGVMHLLAENGARLAEPGEFTKRAFIAGKLDLSQAEAVMDVINASTSRALNAALGQLEGSVGRDIASVENMLLNALSGLEAAIDYPEELEEDVYSDLPHTLSQAYSMLSRLYENGMRQRILREGADVVIAGKPNAGKSSLLNLLTSSDKAIVTPYAGTTRDIIEERASINGIPVLFKDTAGIHASDDPVERLGIERARLAAERAALVLLAFDGGAPLDTDDAKRLFDMTEEKKRLAVICKSDLPAMLDADMLCKLSGESRPIKAVYVSSITGDGLEELKKLIANELLPEDENPMLTNMRHINAVKEAMDALDAISLPDFGGEAALAADADCISTDIRNALHSLAKITGRETDETVTDMIFERFCVGK